MAPSTRLITTKSCICYSPSTHWAQEGWGHVVGMVLRTPLYLVLRQACTLSSSVELWWRVARTSRNPTIRRTLSPQMAGRATNTSWGYSMANTFCCHELPLQRRKKRVSAQASWWPVVILEEAETGPIEIVQATHNVSSRHNNTTDTPICSGKMKTFRFNFDFYFFYSFFNFFLYILVCP